MNYDIFLSYSNKDRDFVVRLAKDLQLSGLKVFYDEWSIQLGDSLAEIVLDAVKKSKYLFAVMSPDYFNSKWAEQEFVFAMNEEIKANTIKVIPILYRKTIIHPMLADKQYADFSDQDNYLKSFNNLLSDLEFIQDRQLKDTLSNEVNEKPEKKKNIIETSSIQAGEDIHIGDFRTDLDNESIKKLNKLLADAVDAFQSKPNSSKDENEIIAEEDNCFIVMPFGNDELNIVYEDFVKPTVEDCGLICERGDDVFGSNIIMDDIQRSILKSKLIIADLTSRNANVFYEVGIAHALNKKVLLLTQDIDDVPFDLRHRRVLIYEYSPRGCKKLEKDLEKNIKSMIN